MRYSGRVQFSGVWALPHDPGQAADNYQEQLQRGFLFLRFESGLETEFRRDYLESVVPQRMVLLGIVVFLIAILPALDEWVIMTPEHLRTPFRWAQFGVMMPSAWLAMAVTLSRWRQRWADPVGLLCAFSITGGLLYQRMLGAAHGFNVPSELIAVVISAVFLVAGIRFRLFVTAALAIFVAFVVGELQTSGANPATSYVIIAMTMLMLIVGVGAYINEYAARRDWLVTHLLEQRSLTDPLTGLLNSRAFTQAYERLHALAVRERRPLAVAVADVDYFKAFNDRYGHPAGDDCLVQVAECLSRSARRDSDLRARIGGEEFVMVWYGLALDQVRQQVEQMRRQVAELGITHARSALPARCVTVSVGAIWLVPSHDSTAEQILQSADQRLYVSKQAGRDRVTIGTSLAI